jgi:hypothetical protein
MLGLHASLTAQAAPVGDQSTLDALDNDTRERVIRLFKDELKDTAVIHIGRPETKDHLFSRVLHLIRDPSGTCFIPTAANPTRSIRSRKLFRAEAINGWGQQLLPSL